MNAWSHLVIACISAMLAEVTALPFSLSPKTVLWLFVTKRTFLGNVFFLAVMTSKEVLNHTILVILYQDVTKAFYLWDLSNELV